KVVVLDFWATWCHYCIASFPAMQKAVDKYKNDDTVEFLFVNTLEHARNPEARKKRILDFAAHNPYTFHIVMDEKATGGFQVADAYGVNGIPAKFIIGPEGHIKFIKSGYDGYESALLREIAAMVALAQGKG
ncbi:MAG: TlpA disulfide reductase family protein, partial [Flavobacteriales bacterium]